MNSQQPKKIDGLEEKNNWKKERFKIFILESLREPIDEFKDMFFRLGKGFHKPKIWKYAALFITLMSIIAKNRMGALIGIMLVIFADRYDQWINGNFMYKYRKRKYHNLFYKK